MKYKITIDLSIYERSRMTPEMVMEEIKSSLLSCLKDLLVDYNCEVHSVEVLGV
jgi:hypothetical protein